MYKSSLNPVTLGVLKKICHGNALVPGVSEKQDCYERFLCWWSECVDKWNESERVTEWL